MAFSYYRIHAAGEPVESILDPRRRDGWVAADEDAATQPLGVSCCETLEDLRCYIALYSLSVRPGDRLVRVIGRLSPEADRDQHAVRVLAESVEVLGDAADLLLSEAS